MRKIILPLLIVLILGISVYAQNAQVSPVSNLDGSNASVVNGNMGILQTGVNNLYSVYTTISGYFSSGILNTANGGTSKNLHTCTQGSVPYFSATGVMSCLAPTTSGYILKTKGVGADPAFEATTVPIGWNLISSTALSGVASSGDIAITAGHFYHVKYAFDSSNNDNLSIRINNDTGTNYGWSLQTQNIGISASPTTTKGTTATSMFSGMGISSSSHSYFDFYIYSSADMTFIYGTGFDSGAPNQYTFCGRWTGNSATSFRLITASGSLNGTVYLYEIKTS